MWQRGFQVRVRGRPAQAKPAPEEALPTPVKQATAAPTGPAPATACACGGGCPACGPKQSPSGPSAQTAGGQPLDPDLRRAAEVQLSTPLNHVTVTDKGPLAEKARARGATAAASGSQIAFPGGVPRADTPAGRFQLGHELGHVAGAGGAKSPMGAAEGQADATGRALSGAKDATGAPATGHPGPDALNGQTVHYGFFDRLAEIIDDPIGFAQRLDSELSIAGGRILAALPGRTTRLIEEAIDASVPLTAWTYEMMDLIITDQPLDRMVDHVIDGVWNGRYMAGEFLGALVDVFGINEVAHAIFNASNALDRLDPSEIAASKHVHPPGLIPYSRVRVDRDGIVARLAALSGDGVSVYNQVFGPAATVQHRSVTTMHVIHTGTGIMSPGLAVHELTHVGQFTMTGSRYMAQALHAQLEGLGYDYRLRDRTLAASVAAGRSFLDFNGEQQAQICQDYYDQRFTGSSRFGAPLADLEHFVRDLWRIRGATWPIGGP